MSARITEPAVDHRRAIALRNAAAILDATERLLARNASLSMAAIAAEAGLSRPTLYAHFKAIGDIVEAAVERSVAESLAAIEAARPEEGPADEALRRMAEASWGQLARFQGLARRAAEHLSRAPCTARMRRSWLTCMPSSSAASARARFGATCRPTGWSPRSTPSSTPPTTTPPPTR